MPLLNRSNSYGRRRGSFRNLNGNHVDGEEGGSGMELPHAYIDYESPPRRSPSPTMYRMNHNRYADGGGGGISWKVIIGTIMALVVVAGYSLASYHERKMMIAQLLQQETTMRELEIDLSMKFDTKLKKLQYENAALQRKLGDQKSVGIENQNLKTKVNNLETQIQEGIHREEHLEGSSKKLVKEKNGLQRSIQHMSKTALVEKFGHGPHRLEIVVRFDSHKGFDDWGTITIELGPIDELPHASYWFLEQVSRKLFDGTSFHHNPRHIVQAGVASNFLSTPENMPSIKKFEDSGFPSILFQEYSKNFPHQKYTLGYAGRPGGPDFYINSVDNTKAHGPGGQKNAANPNEADTCFAKVVDGFDIVDRIGGLPVKKGSSELHENVAITYIRLKTEKTE